ncbi:MAG: hypothetical protein ABJB03_04695 [Rhodoglobus sp.]
MTARAPLPPDFAARSFLARVALDAGISPKRLRAKDLSGDVWGTRAPSGAAGDLRAKCSRYLLRMPPHAVFTHVTAARLHGLPLPPALERRRAIDVSFPAPRRAPDIRGIRGHQLRRLEESVASLDGLPVTTVARTWCDLATLLDLGTLVAVGDAIIYHRRNLATLEELQRAVDEFPGRRGRAALGRALPLLSGRAESPGESRLRVILASSGFPRLLVNTELRDRMGRFVARPDLRFADFPIAIEYEGDYHRTDREQWMKDVTRIADVEGLGLTVIRCTAADVRDSASMIRRVEAHLARHGWKR